MKTTICRTGLHSACPGVVVLNEALVGRAKALGLKVKSVREACSCKCHRSAIDAHASHA